MKKLLGNWIARLVWGLMRGFILGMPDRVISMVMRAIRGLLWVLTGDRQLRSVMTEVVEIFEDGPPGTDTVRIMFREANPGFAADLLREALGF